jgi:biotin carboxyl carrier protein
VSDDEDEEDDDDEEAVDAAGSAGAVGSLCAGTASRVAVAVGDSIFVLRVVRVVTFGYLA